MGVSRPLRISVDSLELHGSGWPPEAELRAALQEVLAERGRSLSASMMVPELRLRLEPSMGARGIAEHIASALHGHAPPRRTEPHR